MWPIVNKTIDGYPGWEVKLRELSVDEVRAFRDAVNMDGDFDNKQEEVLSSLLPTIVSWNFITPEGEGIPVSLTGYTQLPNYVAADVFGMMTGMVNVRPFGTPTNTSES